MMWENGEETAQRAAQGPSDSASTAAVAPVSATRKSDGTHRVVITGMGALTPAGAGVPALWDAVMAGRSCIGPITRFDTAGFETRLGGQIPDYDPVALGLTKKEVRRFARFVQYAIIAAEEAMAQSGLRPDEADAARIGCVFGTGIGGLEEFENGCATLTEKGPRRLNPLFIPTMITNMAAGNLSIRYVLRGECL